MAKVLPNGKQQYFYANGDPLNGGKVYTYESGTTTPKATYADAGETVLNTNPVILDSRGEATIFWNGTYTETVKDSLDNTIYSQDGLSTTTEITDIEYDGITLDVILENNLIWAVTNITALKALDSTLHAIAYAKGYTTAGDGGGGVYLYDSGDTTSSDNGGSIIVGNDGARWKLQTFGQPWSVRQFGAVCDYVTDDTTAIQAAIDALGADGGVVVIDGWALIGDLTINSNCTLKGINGLPAQSTTGNYGPAAAPSGLVLPAANTITMGATGSRIEGITIIEQELAPGQTYPLPLTSANAASAVSAFSGTAISFPDPCYDAEIINCAVMGFNYVCDTFDSNSAVLSVLLDHVIFDCTNGVKLYASGVKYTSFLRDCRGEPFLTAHLADATKDQRTGIAFYTQVGGYTLNGCKARDKNGFLADNVFIAHNNCSVVNDDSTANSYYGFKYITGGYSVSNIGCIALNCGGSNIYSDLPIVSGVETCLSVVGATLDNTTTTSAANGLVYVTDGFYSLTGVNFGYNGVTGYIKLGANAEYGTLDGCSFYGSQTPVFGDATAIKKLRFGNVSYRDTSNPTSQEFTWTPAITIGATAQTGTTAYGHYTITNQHVTCYFDITMTAETGTGNVTITGLPFTASNDTNAMLGMGNISYYANLNGLTGIPTAAVAKNTTVIDLYQTSATGVTALTEVEVTATSRLVGWVTYRIDN